MSEEKNKVDRLKIQIELEKFVSHKNYLVKTGKLSNKLFDEVVSRWIERNVPIEMLWIGDEGVWKLT